MRFSKTLREAILAMARYIFSGGKIRVERGANLKPQKRRHALGSTVLLIIEHADWPAGHRSHKWKENRSNGQG